VLPRGATFGLAAAAGALIALSLPPWGWWPLGVLGLAGFAALLDMAPAAGRPMRARAVVGSGVALGQFGVGLWWVTEFHVAGYVGLILHGMACYALAAAAVPGRRRWGLLLGLPAALVAADWIRDNFPAGGLPIGGTSLGQVGGPLVPTVRLGGSLLLVGVTALAGAGLADLGATGWRWMLARQRVLSADEPPATRQAAPVVRGLVALALTAAFIVAGRLSPDGAGGGAQNHRGVAAVQGGGQRGLPAVATDPELVTQRQLDASAVLQPPLDLVVWPEDVIHVDRSVEGTPEADAVSALASRLHTTVEAGVVENVGTDRFRNAAVVWGPDGRIVARYDKVHRVPFGEYVPARGLVEHLASLSLLPADAIAGRGPGLLLTPAGPLGVLISYEVFFDERARAAVHAGGQLLLVPTNAASYSNTQVPAQEVAATRLRAIETGRDAVQSSPTGYSAFVNHDGRVLSRSGLGPRQVLVGAVEMRTGQTVFVRYGDLPVLALCLVGLAAAWLRSWAAVLRSARARES
jgi:apolipoprotein N-acyltransferase